MSLRIVRPITVKVIVTQELKERLALDLQRSLQRIDGELQQIDKLSPERIVALKGQIDTERQKRLDMRKELLDKLKVIAALELGQEHVHSTVESIMEVNVGDIWQRPAEIVLKDDRIVEIR